MQEHLDLVRSNFQFVFKDIMDLDHFESNMFFSDPISKFTFFRGKLMPCMACLLCDSCLGACTAMGAWVLMW